MQLKQVGHNFVAKLLPMGLQMVAFILLARWLSPAKMGEWSFYFMLHALLEKFRSSFLQNGLIRLLRQEANHRPAILASAWTLQLGLTLSAILLVFLSFPWMATQWEMPLLLEYLPYYPFVAIASGVFQTLQVIQMADNRFDRVRNGSVVMSAIWTIGVLYACWQLSTEQLLPLLWFQLGAYLFGILATGGRIPFQRPARTWLQALVQFGRYTTASTMGSMLFSRMDLLLIGYFLNPVAVGLYSVATRINTYMEIPLNVVSQVSYTTLSSELKQGQRSKTVFLQPLIIIFALTLPAALVTVFAAPQLVQLLAGSAYLEVAPLLVLMASMSLIKPFGRLFGLGLEAIGKPQINSRTVWLSLLLNAVLNCLLIPIWGYYGAGVATVLATWISILLRNWWMRKTLALPVWAAFRGIWGFYATAWEQLQALLLHRSTQSMKR